MAVLYSETESKTTSNCEANLVTTQYSFANVWHFNASPTPYKKSI